MHSIDFSQTQLSSTLKSSIQEEIEINCATDMGEVLQRGRLYERYRERREAKLREEWFLKMEGKEAEIRAMWDRFERAKTTSSQQESESTRLSDVRLHSRARQEMRNSVPEEKRTKGTASRNNSMKRSDVDRTTFSMPLTTKENKAPLAKDRPSTSSSSMSSQRSLSRSRTITDEQKNHKPMKSHHRRNTLAGPVEFRGLVLDKNYFHEDNCGPEKRHVGKLFLRKGCGIGAGAGAAITKQRSSSGGDLTLSQELLTDFRVLGSAWSTGSDQSGDCYSNKEAQSVGRERKKWGIPEKPQIIIFSGTWAQEAAGTRGLKKLLPNIAGKSKLRDRDSSVMCA